jgi:hypothetical protein
MERKRRFKKHWTLHEISRPNPGNCAVTSYVRQLRDESRVEEALSLLKPVCGRFSDGHDTHDLQEAAALLAELT